MKVILTENVSNLGEIGEVVNVANGYGRNYLLPKGLAMAATGKNVAEVEDRKRALARKRELVRQEMLSLAEKLNQVRLVLRRKVSDDNKLYGSVSASDILVVLEEQGFGVTRKNVQLDQPIKQLGEYTVPIRIGSEISANIHVAVEKDEQ